MSLSSLYKGKGLILRLAGIMVLLLLLSFALIPQPAAAGDPSTYPDPDDGNAYGCSVTIYAKVVGTGQFIPPAKVMAGDQIQYTLSLVVPTMPPGQVGFYFQQGELSCTLPDGTYVKVAGFGTDSPAWPLVPTITTVPTAFLVPQLYTVNPADAVLGKLIAYVDYGGTVRYPAQLNGIYHNTPSNPQQTASATSSHPTPLVTPDTLVGISADPNPVLYNSTVALDIYEGNTGNIALSTPSVVVYQGLSLIYTLTAPPTSGDTNSNVILETTETWHWTRTSNPITGPTTFTVYGHGYFNGHDISYDNEYKNERATTYVTVLGSIEILKKDGYGDPLAGSTFRISPNPLTGTGYLDVVDDGANDEANTTPGRLLVTHALLDIPYTIHEQVVPTGYDGAADQSGTITSETSSLLLWFTFTNTAPPLPPVPELPSVLLLSLGLLAVIGFVWYHTHRRKAIA